MDADIKRILLIMGDDALRRTLAEQLAQQDGLWAMAAASDAAALALLAGSGADAALLDAGLAENDGDGPLIPRLRAGGLAGPVILLLSPDGIALPGADDHMSRPFRLGVLLARLRALLRLADAGAAAGQTRHIGPYRFQPAAKRLATADGRHVRLTEKETQILDHLCRCGGAAPRQSLLDAVWGYGAGIDTHTLETHIYRLRRKMEAEPARARLLVTEAGGYRLVN